MDVACGKICNTRFHSIAQILRIQNGQDLYHIPSPNTSMIWDDKTPARLSGIYMLMGLDKMDHLQCGIAKDFFKKIISIFFSWNQLNNFCLINEKRCHQPRDLSLPYFLIPIHFFVMSVWGCKIKHFRLTFTN